jgi:hypothetical protein
MELKNIAVNLSEDNLEIFLVAKCSAETVETGKVLGYLPIGIKKLVECICMLVCNLEQEFNRSLLMWQHYTLTKLAVSHIPR